MQLQTPFLQETQGRDILVENIAACGLDLLFLTANKLRNIRNLLSHRTVTP
ncbi:Non-structural protein 2, partial [Clarias magur]